MLFSKLAEAYEDIEAVSGRLEMTGLLSEVFKAAKPEEAKRIVYLTQGTVAPSYAGIEVGMGEKFVERAIALATGYLDKQVEAEYKKSGDLGKVAEKFVATRKQRGLASEELTVKKVFDVLSRIAVAGGAGSQEAKIKSLAELLNSASPSEAKFIVRFPLGKLRLGVGDPTMVDALSFARKGDKADSGAIARAYNMCDDLGLVAESYLTDAKSIAKFKPRVFSPIRPSLAERLPTAEEIIKKLGKCSVEAKYDGFRMQVHKQGDKVEIFSRKQERMTHMFPEIVEGVRKQVKAKEAIVEGEALAFNAPTGQFFPFQMTIQRKRKHGVAEMAEKYPLHLFLFDALFIDGEDLTTVPYVKRREKMGKMLAQGDSISLAESIVTDKPQELEKYFEEAVERGLEGIIAKDLKSPYVAGARQFAWIKLKRSYRGELSDTVDLVIVGYYLGRGMRTEFGFGGVLCAVRDEDEGRLKTVAKIGSGFSEEEMSELKKTLDKIRVKDKPKRLDSMLKPDVWVEPKYVITVAADEITRSPMHTCGMKGDAPGYALRFPRMVGAIRSDKGVDDATTVNEIVEMQAMQRKVEMSESGEAG
ncbi:DNA ligase [Candidatus Burarchaeum australiense]|nr:DNA ligase [Candidatus Burarchaeum australiense]